MPEVGREVSVKKKPRRWPGLRWLDRVPSIQKDRAHIDRGAAVKVEVSDLRTELTAGAYENAGRIVRLRSVTDRRRKRIQNGRRFDLADVPFN